MSEFFSIHQMLKCALFCLKWIEIKMNDKLNLIVFSSLCNGKKGEKNSGKACNE